MTKKRISLAKSATALGAIAEAYRFGYEHLQTRLKSIGREVWAHDMDEEILHHSKPAATAPEQAYLDLLQFLRDEGVLRGNRTGVGTYTSPGHMLKFDLRDGFPALTTKKLAFKSGRGELLGFFRGYDNAADFRALGCKFWDQNANETPSWLSNPNRKGTDDLGRIYGVQWTKFRDTRVARTSREKEELLANGYYLLADDKERGVAVVEREINQLEETLRTLLTNPNDRRMLITAWRPDEFDQMSLPPCHVSYNYVCLPDNTLHLCMYMRSSDLLLGVPVNIATTSMMLAVMARLSGKTAATVTVFMADTHLYENHVEQALEQVQRTPYAPAKLVLSDNIKPITDLSQIKGAFERIEPEDIELVDYVSHAALKAPMAA